MVVSLPAYLKVESGVLSLNDTTYESVMVKLKNPDSLDDIEEFKKTCKKFFNPIESNGIQFYDYYDDQETN